ncbi:ABC transporter ATP-binding protein [Mesoterricola sediminis]|uniref:Iron ABC transporter ATP-binding protein n=1 Tax=Mesoterricola sediminis TaxID=2927980 RepID=A0AA48GL56_9BACT|nr:ABC transporter ATP-binding protein [Mesoterricola sediminis]BDU75086.1 iron ABC transporter ATP-binding protein [Mesoterricola sediminis]
MLSPVLEAAGLDLPGRLRDISFAFEAGAAVAVVGPNGAGKSTLLQVLAGLLHAKGRIRWRGEDLPRIPFLERGRILTWLGQESHADFAYPVKEVVAQGRFAWGDDGRGVEEAMEALDIRHLATRPITELSGGERRRVFLARALATGAPIQLWDEPAANLDVRHALDVLRLARDLAGSGSTLLVTLHDLRNAYRFDRVLVLDQGALVGAGTPAEILTPDLIARVFRVRAEPGAGLGLELPDA